MIGKIRTILSENSLNPEGLELFERRSFNELYCTADLFVKVAKRRLAELGDRLGREFRFYSILRREGINCPEPIYFDFTKAHLPHDVAVLSRISSDSFQRERQFAPAGEREEKFYRGGQTLARIHQCPGIVGRGFLEGVHQTQSDGDFPFLGMGGLVKLIKEFEGVLSPRVVKALTNIGSISFSSSLLHGDYHPGNWIFSNEELYVIDGECAFKGPPEYDLGRSFVYVQETEDRVALLRGYLEANPHLGLEDLEVLGSLAGLELLAFVRDKRKRGHYINGLRSLQGMNLKGLV